MSPEQRAKELYGEGSDDFNEWKQNQAEKERKNLAYKSGDSGGLIYSNPNPAYSSAKNSSIDPKFSGYMQTSLGYAKYSSASKASGTKNPNPQSPIPVLKK